MRYLIDTNIFIYYAKDLDMLGKDVRALLEDYDNTICISVESMRELVVSFNNGGLVSKYWKSAREMLDSITDEYYIEILPLTGDYMKTYSELRLNTKMNHKDPSDHVIISHAITMGIPLISSDGKFEFYRDQGLDFIYNDKPNSH
ncbi:MAG: type II toxin-antitoxin system VapC family toxin [Prevotella sp.]|nr:type II toxin-antitoxin system VapC family toxin [Prevotella sp.]MDE6354911.1 type II toxin-antitoxin system VapC family toxin [Prevotella sp.]